METKYKALTKDQVLFLWEELNEVQKGNRYEVTYERSFEVVVMATRLQKDWHMRIENQPVNVVGELEEFEKIKEKLIPYQRSVHDYEPLDVMQYVVTINIILRLASNILNEELEVNQISLEEGIIGAGSNQIIGQKNEFMIE